MTTWGVSQEMPAGLAAACRAADNLFHTEAWMSVLKRGLGCESVFVVEAEEGRGAGISSFQAGPFRVGYLGFPVGGMIGGEAPSDAICRQIRNALSGEGLVALRIPVSSFVGSATLDLPYAATPETAIVDLQSWSLSTIPKNRRRDVNKSLRAGLDVVDASEPSDGDTLYKLYEKTLERKRGSLRYTASYFKELIRFAQENPNVRVLLAKLGSAIAAYTVIVRHGPTAYYLHGAFDWEMREHIPSAMLLNEAIEWAKCEGCRIFNLMPSPPEQESLIRYKEHWGAITREHRTYTLPISRSYSVFRVAEKLYRHFR